MKTVQNKTVVKGIEEIKETFIKKTGQFLIFKIEWYEKVDTEHIGNDIVIMTDHFIRNIILNGEIVAHINPELLK